jgi:hypothetical protein
LALVSCGDGGGSDSTSTTYNSTDSAGNSYKLTITKDPSRAAYNPQVGDTYVLIITLAAGGTKTSTGTVTVSGSTFTLTNTSGKSFTVTVSSGEIETITAEEGIPLDDGSTITPTPIIPSDGDSISGSTITSGAPVIVFGSSTSSATDFSFTSLGEYWDYGTTTGGDWFDKIKPLSDLINEPASAKVNNGKVEIKLGVPKELYTWHGKGNIIFNPADAKIYRLDFCITSDGKNSISCLGKYDDYAVLIYANKNVTITGTTDPDTYTYNATLKAGWNYLIWSLSGNTWTVTASTTMPRGYIWVMEYNRFKK